VISAGIAAVCVCFLAWFARRARIGARSRAAGGVRLHLFDRLGSVSARAIAARAAFGALLGMFLGGAALAAVGGVAGAVSGPVGRARAARKSEQKLAEQLPDLLRALSAALRAGRSLPQALGAARDEATAPVRTALDTAVKRLEFGASLDESLDAFAARAASPDAALAVETLKIGRAAGANLPAILDVAVESLAERERIARDRRAASAQAKMSGLVVGLMPVAFFAMVGSGARDQVRILFGDPIGWVLLATGLVLEAGGALWMRALLRPR
jgi:tight adherence protein B